MLPDGGCQSDADRLSEAGLNGRLCARLQNGEDIIISRKYVNSLREILKRREGSGNE